MWRTTLNGSWLDEIVYKDDRKDNTKKVVIWVMIVSPKLYSLKFSLIMNNNRISENCLWLIIKCRIYRFNLHYIKNRKRKQKKKIIRYRIDWAATGKGMMYKCILMIALQANFEQSISFRLTRKSYLLNWGTSKADGTLPRLVMHHLKMTNTISAYIHRAFRALDNYSNYGNVLLVSDFNAEEHETFLNTVMY